MSQSTFLKAMLDTLLQQVQLELKCSQDVFPVFALTYSDNGGSDRNANCTIAALVNHTSIMHVINAGGALEDDSDYKAFTFGVDVIPPPSIVPYHFTDDAVSFLLYECLPYNGIGREYITSEEGCGWQPVNEDDPYGEGFDLIVFTVHSQGITTHNLTVEEVE